MGAGGVGGDLVDLAAQLRSASTAGASECDSALAAVGIATFSATSSEGRRCRDFETPLHISIFGIPPFPHASIQIEILFLAFQEVSRSRDKYSLTDFTPPPHPNPPSQCPPSNAPQSTPPHSTPPIQPPQSIPALDHAHLEAIRLMYSPPPYLSHLPPISQIIVSVSS